MGSGCVMPETNYMRFIVCLCSLLAFTGIARAQQKSSVGAYTSFINGGSVFVRNAPSNKHVTGTTVAGFEYTRGVSKSIKLTAGVEYSNRSVEDKQGFVMMSISGLTSFYVINTGKVEMVSVPINVRIDFLKYFFLSSGAVLDLELKNNIMQKQSGIGLMGGLGAKYDFKKKPFTLLLQPYFQSHNFITFHSNAYREHLINGGIKVGASYRL